MDSLMFVRLAAAILAAALIFIIIGLSTNNWVSYGYGHFGLWESCVQDEDFNVCIKLNDQIVDGQLEAVRAMVILSLLCCAVATVVCILWAINISLTEGKIIRIVAIATAFAAAVFGLIGIIIFSSETLLENMELSWSFALAVIGAIASGAGGGLLFPALSQSIS